MVGIINLYIFFYCLRFVTHCTSSLTLLYISYSFFPFITFIRLIGGNLVMITHAQNYWLLRSDLHYAANPRINLIVPTAEMPSSNHGNVTARSSDNFANGLRRPNSRILPAGENVSYVTARVQTAGQVT